MKPTRKARRWTYTIGGQRADRRLLYTILAARSPFSCIPIISMAISARRLAINYTDLAQTLPAGDDATLISPPPLSRRCVRTPARARRRHLPVLLIFLEISILTSVLRSM